jgi:hypothetical protein
MPVCTPLPPSGAPEEDDEELEELELELSAASTVALLASSDVTPPSRGRVGVWVSSSSSSSPKGDVDVGV